MNFESYERVNGCNAGSRDHNGASRRDTTNWSFSTVRNLAGKVRQFEKLNDDTIRSFSCGFVSHVRKIVLNRKYVIIHSGITRVN